jgi:serine/threonine-protein kinase
MPHELPSGHVVADRYRIERKLGTGAMGVVYLATQLDLRRKVALKLMLPEARARADADLRFLREAQAAAVLESEHAVQILDTGRLPTGEPYLVMEYLEGEDLAALLARSGRLPIGDACWYVAQACQAIAEAHARGIVHRDLKPSNLFLARRFDGSPRVVVLDFGISKALDPDAAGAALDLTGGSFLGSPVYMSPEQVRGSRDVGPQTDVWSLGLVLQELLTGKRVFDAPTLTALSAMIACDAPPSLRALRPETPPELEAIVARCLDKDPARRFPTVAELARALEPFHGRGSLPMRAPHSIEVPASRKPDAFAATITAPSAAPLTSAPPPQSAPPALGPTGTLPSPNAPPPPPRRSMVFPIGGALVVLAGGLGGLLLFLRRPAELPASVAPPASATSAQAPPPDANAEDPLALLAPDAAIAACRTDGPPAPVEKLEGEIGAVRIAAGQDGARLVVGTYVPDDGGKRRVLFKARATALGPVEASPVALDGNAWGVPGLWRGLVAWTNRAADDGTHGALVHLGAKDEVLGSRAAPHASREFAAVVVAGQPLAVSVGDDFRDGKPTARVARTFVGFGDAGSVLRAWSPRDATAAASAPALAVSPNGQLAVALKTQRHVLLARLDGAGAAQGGLRELGRGFVGAPALAWEGETLHVVWAQRATQNEAYRLYSASWRAGEPEPTASERLGTGGASAFAPSVDAQPGRVLVGFMEEEEGKGRVRVGAGKTLSEAVQAAVVLSKDGVDARDPKVALAGRRAWVAWTEYANAKEAVILSRLACE